MLQSTQDKLREAVTQSKIAILQNLLKEILEGSLNFFQVLPFSYLIEVDLNITFLDIMVKTVTTLHPTTRIPPPLHSSSQKIRMAISREPRDRLAS